MDKIQKETKSRGGGRRVLGMQSKGKGLLLRMEHLVLGPLLRLSQGQTSKGIKIKISREKDQGESFHAQDVEASISLRTVRNGKVYRPCLLRKRSRETEHPVLIAHMVWQPGSRIVLGRRLKSKKIYIKRSNLIIDGTTQKDDNLIKEKKVERPISVSQLGLTEPSQNTGESLWQALNLEDQVVKVGPEVDVGYPLQSAAYAQQQAVTQGDSTEGTTIRPIGSVEATPAEVSSTERIPSQAIELSGMIHRRPIRV